MISGAPAAGRGVAGPAVNHWPVSGALLTLEPAAALDYALPAADRAFSYVLSGRAVVAGRALAAGDRSPGPAAPSPAGSDMLNARLAAVNQATPEDYRRMDTLFHLSIAELTGSSLLAAACADARMRLNDLLNAIPVLQRNIDHTAAQHTAIVTAILAGDPGTAQRAIAEHLDGTAALLRGFLE